MVEERTVAQKVEEVLQQLYGLFTNRDVPIFEKFAHMSQKVATIAEIFFGDKTRTFLTERIKAGYEFGGYGYDGAMLYWWKPEESSTSIEVNPLFLEPEIFSLLSPKMKESVKKCQLEVLQNEINIEFVKIFNVLLESNTALKTFDLQRFRNSDFGNDVFAVLEAGKKVPDGQGYDGRVTEKGVSFMTSDFLKTKKWEDIHLELKDYDQNLNLKALPLAPKPPKIVDIPKEQETSDEKPPEEDPPYRPTDEELQSYEKEVKGYKSHMDELANKIPDLAEIHGRVKQFMDDTEDIVIKGAGNGLSSSVVFGEVLLSLTNIPSLMQNMEYEKTDDLHQEYIKLYGKAIKAPWDFYYPETGN